MSVVGKIMLLSLIIPIYNVEKYIHDCLDSVLKQLPPEVEVILINDGTPDNSMQVVYDTLDQLPEQKKKQFIIINQNNQGISATRNTGLKEAKGEYIAFLDSDDILLDDYFPTILHCINNHTIDIIQFKFLHFLHDKRKFKSSNMSLKKIAQNNLNDGLLRDIFNENAWYPWVRVYKAELFKDIQFPIGYNFEDPAIIPYIFIKAKVVYLIDMPLYGYRSNPEGITQSLSNEVVKKNIQSINYLMSIYIESCKKNNIFIIPTIHFLRIYIEYIFNFYGFFAARKEWHRLSASIDALNINGFIWLTVPKNRAFYWLYQKFGFYSVFIIQVLSHSYGFINRLKQI